VRTRVVREVYDTGADLAKTNVNGGAIAIGHPLGASGTRIMTTMVNALEQRGGRYGLQTMCEAPAAWPTPPSSSGSKACLPRLHSGS
jgi:acetyl-CoA acetyltransferase